MFNFHRHFQILTVLFSLCFQVSATDLDDGVNGRVRYTIISGDDNHDLTISEDNGLLRIAKNLNFERKAQYSLTIQAEDCGGDTDENIRFDTATVSLKCISPPMCIYISVLSNFSCMSVTNVENTDL